MKQSHTSIIIVLMSLLASCTSSIPASSQSLPETSSSKAACSVSPPRRVENRRGIQTYDPSFVVGAERLWTLVQADNITKVRPHQIQENGIMVLKWPWLYKADLSGELTVRGQLVDSEDASPEWYTLASDIEAIASPDTEPGIGVSISYMNFPHQGCWQITVSKGDENFTFITEVRQVQQ